MEVILFSLRQEFQSKVFVWTLEKVLFMKKTDWHAKIRILETVKCDYWTCYEKGKI